MKKTLVIFTIALLSSALSAQTKTVSTGPQTIGELAAEADRQYRIGNYDLAADCYRRILDTGYASADLYYNLANAYYRTGHMGPAILNYKRALRLNPSIADARENLALAENQTVDRITPLPQFFFTRWVDTLCTRITPPVWRIVWLLLLALLGTSVVVFRLGRRRSLRKAGFIATLVLFLFMLIATWLLLRSTTQYNAHRQAVVMPPAIVVKSSPEDSSIDKIILHEGTVVTVVDSLSSWYKITLADGTTGWCPTDNIQRI